MKGKLKNILSKKIFYVTLALILVGVVEIVYASNLINSKNVSYSNETSKLSSTNVQGAIDELYKNCKDVKNECPDGYTCFSTPAASKLKKLVVTSGDGLYQDSVEPDKYFYRGANPDNYIKFNNELWRIININEDGSLRIRRNESIGSRSFDTSSNGRYSSSGGYCNSSSDGCNVWGSKTTMRDKNGNLITKMPRQVGETTTYDLPDKEAELNTYLNGTWYQTLTDKSNVKTNSIYNVGLVFYQESNINQTLETDIEQEKTYTWQENVGLIEISDYPRTNTNQSLCGTVNLNNHYANHYSTCKNTSWIYDSNNDQWSLSLVSRSPSDFVWFVASDGRVRRGSAGTSYAIRPVLNLKSGITLVGTGKLTDPFTIQD